MVIVCVIIAVLSLVGATLFGFLGKDAMPPSTLYGIIAFLIIVAAICAGICVWRWYEYEKNNDKLEDRPPF